LKTAKTLQRENASRADDIRRLYQRLVAARENMSGAIPELKLRAAKRTSVWLSVEPAICRIMVFAIALGTHREFLH
jgi:hypothetical protein